MMTEMTGSDSRARLTRIGRSAHLVLLQAADHQLGEDDHASAAHAGAAVNHHRWVETLGGVQHGVGMSPHGLDLLQVGWRGVGERVGGGGAC